VKTEDFQLLQGLLKERSGLVLSDDKQYLLESRLMPLARKRGMVGLEDLVSAIRSERQESLLRDVTEAMTTNESLFFRDSKPFDQFRKDILPEMMKGRANNKRVRIWSAACSTGQEPYSLAMILKEEAAKLQGWRIEIVATDLSEEVLEKAKAGLYSQFEVQRGLPIQYLMKYFQQIDEMWQIDSAIRAMVKFVPFNLLGSLSPLGAFDVIFCRNVLIYFDNETKTKVLDGMSRMMPSDGVLYLGGAETVLGITDRFAPLQGQRGVYALTEQTMQ
jgi:chemotaxis protein methyltransferase CheR